MHAYAGHLSHSIAKPLPSKGSANNDHLGPSRLAQPTGPGLATGRRRRMPAADCSSLNKLRPARHRTCRSHRPAVLCENLLRVATNVIFSSHALHRISGTEPCAIEYSSGLRPHRCLRCSQLLQDIRRRYRVWSQREDLDGHRENTLVGAGLLRSTGSHVPY